MPENAALSPALVERVSEAIAMYDLHAVLPVPIRQFAREIGADVRFRERMAPLFGWAMMENGLPVFGVNASITSAYQRYVIGHESGHFLAGHLSPGRTRTLAVVVGSAQGDEYIADVIAAYLLVPNYALENERDGDVARKCEVPRRLVALRKRLEG